MIAVWHAVCAHAAQWLPASQSCDKWCMRVHIQPLCIVCDPCKLIACHPTFRIQNPCLTADLFHIYSELMIHACSPSHACHTQAAIRHRAGCWRAPAIARSRPACPSSTTAGPPKCAAHQSLHTLLRGLLTALHELHPRAAASAMPPCTPWTPHAASSCTWRPRRAWCTRPAGRWGCGPLAPPSLLRKPASARYSKLTCGYLSEICSHNQSQPSRQTGVCIMWVAVVRLGGHDSVTAVLRAFLACGNMQVVLEFAEGETMTVCAGHLSAETYFM